MMDNWQFFLQKEGDYAWLPLETPQVEILEGRYQLIARTQAAGSSVRVSIRHQFEQEDIPQESIQDSVRQADLSGKVEILPSVYLGLGAWSVLCQPLADDQTGDLEITDPTSYGLEIQVLPQDFDLFESWNFGLEDDQDSTQQPLLVPEEISLADLNADVPVFEPAFVATAALDVMGQDPEPAISATAEIPIEEPTLNVEPERRSRFEPDNLILPTFAADTPMVEFRTVSSKDLPRLVSDTVVLDSDRSPQLPHFSQSRSIFRTKHEQRSGSLSKIRFIASVVSHHNLSHELQRSTRQEKFQSKLSRLAVGSTQ